MSINGDGHAIWCWPMPSHDGGLCGGGWKLAGGSCIPVIVGVGVALGVVAMVVAIGVAVDCCWCWCVGVG